MKAPLAASLSLATAGLLGLSIHTSYLYTPLPPSPSSGSALNVLLSSLTLFFSLESVWLSLGGVPLASGLYAARCRSTCTLLPLLVVPVLAILYIVGYRLDAAAWCVPLFAALLLSAQRQLGVGGKGWLAGVACPPTAPQDPQSPRLLQEEVEEEREEGQRSSLNAEAPPPAASAPATTCRTQCCLCCCPPAGTPTAQRLGFLAHSALWCAATVFLLLLLGGAGVTAVGWRRYGRRGVQYDLAPSGESRALVHAWCTGPAYSPQRPTIWLDFGGGGHSMSDAFGLQFALNAAGWRTCTQDPPGTAWSPLRDPADQLDALAAARQHALIAATGEKGPFVFLASMDGGAERIYQFALAYPALVAALIPMQYSGLAEFTGYAQYHGLAPDSPALLAYAQAQIASRLALCDAIRLVGVPWGLMPLLTPPSPRFVPQHLQGECHFLNLHHEGQWDMQCRILHAQVQAPATIMGSSLWASSRTLAPGIPVLAIGNFLSDAGVCATLGMQGEACAVYRIDNALGEAFMRSMANMTQGSAYVNICASDSSDVCTDWAGGGATVPSVLNATLAFLGKRWAA
jgi:hypothetical protein